MLSAHFQGGDTWGIGAKFRSRRQSIHDADGREAGEMFFRCQDAELHGCRFTFLVGVRESVSHQVLILLLEAGFQGEIQFFQVLQVLCNVVHI